MTQNLGVLDLILIDLILTKVLFVKLSNTKKITINTKKLLTGNFAAYWFGKCQWLVTNH